MNLRRMEMLLAALALFGVVVVAGYKWLDAAISLDAARQEQQHQRDRTLLLRSLLQHTAVHLSRADLVRLLREDFGKAHLKEQADQIEVDDIVFRFRGDTVSDVSFLGEEDARQR